jgi:hypothetical protein
MMDMNALTLALLPLCLALENILLREFPGTQYTVHSVCPSCLLQQRGSVVGLGVSLTPRSYFPTSALENRASCRCQQCQARCIAPSLRLCLFVEEVLPPTSLASDETDVLLRLQTLAPDARPEVVNMATLYRAMASEMAAEESANDSSPKFLQPIYFVCKPTG